jgi:putative transposase
MRNIRAAVRRRAHDAVTHAAQQIYGAASLAAARRAFLQFKWNWRTVYPGRVRRRQQDWPELLTFFRFPRHRWRKLRPTNVLERGVVEVRRRTRPMVCFVNVESVARIIYAIFNGVNEKYPGKNRTPAFYTSSLTSPKAITTLKSARAWHIVSTAI